MDSHSRTYEYAALASGQIRVLCLQPGQHGAPLVASLETLDLAHIQDLYRAADRADYEHPLLKIDIEPTKARLRATASESALIAASQLDYMYRLAQLVDQTARTLDSMIHAQIQACSVEALLERMLRVEGLNERTKTLQELTELTDRDYVYCSYRFSDDAVLTQSHFRESWKELSLYSWMIDYDLRDHLVQCAALLGSYEAISYVWGSPIVSENILIAQKGTIAITPSLHEALQHLRYDDRPRRLWVDAVCIDQNNMSERTAQVTMMSSIYKTATRVVAWLGLPNGPEEGQGLALALAYRASRTLRYFYPQLRCLPADLRPAEMLKVRPRCFFRHTNVEVEHTSLDDDMKVDFEFLGKKAYFQRLWVVQELLVSNHAEMQCGPHRAPWLDIHEYDDPWEFYNMIQVWSLSCGPYSPNKLLSLLLRLRDRLCVDPRDRLFAIHTLAKLDKSQLLSNLHYGMTELEVYRLVTLEILGTTFQPLDDDEDSLPHSALILAMAYRSSNDSEGDPDRPAISAWPSWVPDFGHLPSSTQDQFYLYQYVERYRARPGAQHERLAVRSDDKSPSILHLHVAVVGYVVAVSAAFSILASVQWKSKMTQEDQRETNAIVESSTGRVAGDMSGLAIVGDLVAALGGAPQPFVFRDTGTGTYRLLGDATLDLGQEDFDARKFYAEHEQLWIAIE